MRDKNGRFLPGPDEARHVHQFTDADRRAAWETTFLRLMKEQPWMLAWFTAKVKRTAKDRRKQ
jgi:hypothetical protein